MTNRPARHARRLAEGLTLLEVILALTLGIILVGGVYAFYSQSLGVRDALHEQVDTLLARRRVLDMVAEDLRSALVYSTLGAGLTGSGDDVAVARAVVPSQAVYLEREGIGTPTLGEAPSDEEVAFEPQHDVQLVTYRLNRYTDEEGLEQIGGLERLCQRTILAETAEEGSNVEAVLLSRHIRFLRVQYWDGQQWSDSWQRGPLPQAVRVDLGVLPLADGLESEEYPYDTTWRVIAIPAGLSGAASAGPRGRDAAGGPTR